MHRRRTYKLQCTMEREVVLNLLQRFLEKRGVQSVIVKQVLRLIAYGKADGKFVHFFEEEAWHKFGDTLWLKVIDEDTGEEKLKKAWRKVINCIKKNRIEKQVEATASRNLAGLHEDTGLIKPGCDFVPVPPYGASFPVRTSGFK